MENTALKCILIFSGTVSLAMGILGVFLPILPTTPFLLLSAACYTKSSKKFYSWLINNRFLGDYIRYYQEGKGIARNVKIATVLILWITMLFSAFYVVSISFIRFVLIIIAICVTIHILSLKTLQLDD